MEFRAAPPNATDAILAAQKAALQTVVVWLRTMNDSDMSEERRLKAMTEALTKEGVPQALWPKVDGTFDA
jgi:hypothetical protein